MRLDTGRWHPTRWLLWILGVWAAVCVAFLLLATLTSPDPVVRAVLGMGLGLAVAWIGVGGALMVALRRPLRAVINHCARHPRLVFVVVATALALIEEAITTTLTNLAPWWGLTPEQAHITSSTNYLDVVLLHSVVVFVPAFVVWAWLLGRYRFAPGTVLLLFGLTGLLAEALSGGLVNPIQVGFWVFVYGLMVYPPADSFPDRPDRRQPGFLITIAAIILPLLAAAVAAIILLLLDLPHHDLPPLPG